MVSWLSTPFSMACRIPVRLTGPASVVTSTQSSDTHAAIRPTSLDTIARLKSSSTFASSSKIASDTGTPLFLRGDDGTSVLRGQRRGEAPLHLVGTHVLDARGDGPAQPERVQDHA